jgi:hypothetical protein
MRHKLRTKFQITQFFLLHQKLTAKHVIHYNAIAQCRMARQILILFEAHAFGTGHVRFFTWRFSQKDTCQPSSHLSWPPMKRRPDL